MSARVSVLFFTSSLGKGGAEMHLVRILNHMDREQFQVSVALVRGGETYEQRLADDVAVHHLGTGGTGSSVLALWRAVAPLRDLIERVRPNVVCSIMDPPSIAAARAITGMNLPGRLVMSVQVPPLMNYQQAKAHGGVRRMLYRRAMLWLSGAAYSEATRIIAISRGVAEDIARLSPQVANRVHVVYNAGVERGLADLAAEPVEDLPASAKLVVACGRLTEQKGFAYLLHAFARVRKDYEAELWILGEGPLEAKLKELAERLQIREHVRFLGFQPNPFKFMAAADLFVLSSLFEGFGNVVAEAMACGAPVVATDCPYGPGEIIRDGESGLLVEPANAESLAEAMARVFSDPELGRRLAAAGRTRAMDFSAEASAEGYERVFREVASR